MATYLSPGVYTKEIDLSLYVPNLSSTSLGLVGFATKGPLDTPTYITDLVQFASTFGDPAAGLYGAYAALEYLTEGRQLYYVRASAKGIEDPESPTLDFTAESANVTVAAETVTIDGGGAGTITGTNVPVLTGTFVFDGHTAAAFTATWNDTSIQTTPETVTVVGGAAQLAHGDIVAGSITVDDGGGYEGPDVAGVVTLNPVNTFGVDLVTGAVTTTLGDGDYPVKYTFTSTAIITAATGAIATTEVAAGDYEVAYHYNQSPAKHGFAVVAVMQNGAETAVSDVTYTTDTGLQGGTATGPTLVAPSTPVTVNWTAVDGAYGYNVYRYDSAGVSLGKVNTTLVKRLSFKDSITAAPDGTVPPSVNATSEVPTAFTSTLDLYEKTTTASMKSTLKGTVSLTTAGSANDLVFMLDDNEITTTIPIVGSSQTFTVYQIAAYLNTNPQFAFFATASVETGTTKLVVTSKTPGTTGSVSGKTATTTVTSFGFPAYASKVSGTGAAKLAPKVIGTSLAFTTPGLVVPTASTFVITRLEDGVTLSNTINVNITGGDVTFTSADALATFLNADPVFNGTETTADEDISHDGYIAYGLDSGTRGFLVIVPKNANGVSTAVTTVALAVIGVPSTTVTGTSPSTALSFTATSPGTWGNTVGINITAGNTASSFHVSVYENGILAEKYTDLVRMPVYSGVDSNGANIPNPKYVETAINGVSTRVTVDDPNTNDGLYLTLVPKIDAAGDTNLLTGGSNGLPVNSLDVSMFIGVITDTTKTGLQHFRNPEGFDVNLLAVPGVSDPAVHNELASICTSRADCMFIFDAPYGLKPQQVVDWHNGVGQYADHAAFNTSYGALYWPWQEVYDPVTKGRIWTPPSGHIAKAYAYNDRVSELWFAPAGLNRGHLLEPIRAEYVPTLGERDLLYGNGNAVNPIATFRTDGINIWGQRTLQRKPSALDRINVRRLLLYLEKVIATATRYFTFEPNDPITWLRFTDVVTPILEGVKNRRGLKDFKVLCDATVNTTDVVERNEMRALIYVTPLKTAEMIELDFIITSQNSSFTEKAV